MAWHTLCDELEFLTQYPEVAVAVSDSSSPTAGYLYGQINGITYIDYGCNCKPLVAYLISKLTATAPLVSIKTLKLLLYLVKNGHKEIMEEVKIHEVALKEAMGFYGPPDDLHGKAFYESIRNMAKELLEYVFSENNPINESPPASTQSELTGYGSNSSSKQLPGFGFTVKTPKTVSEKLSEGLTSIVEKLIPSSETEQPTPISGLSQTLPHYKPLTIDKASPDLEEALTVPKAPVVASSTPKKKVNVYKPGRPGGGWDDSDDDEFIPVSAEEITSQKSCASVDSFDFSQVELKETTMDWEEERSIVEKFTVDEDLFKIKSSDITVLAKRCSSINWDQVLTFTAEKFLDKSERVQLRAMILVEYLIFHDIISLDSVTKLALPTLISLVDSKTAGSKAVNIKAKKLQLIIQNLGKFVEQCHHQKPSIERTCELQQLTIQ